MADNKKSFLLYCDLIHTVKKLPKEKQGELFIVNDLDPEVEDLNVDLVFEPIKRQLKRDLIKYEGKKKQWSAAGKASAKARKKKSTDVNNRSTDSTVTVNVNDTVNVTDIESNNKAHDFLMENCMIQLESISMKYSGKISDWDEMVEIFNLKVDKEELEYKPRVLLSRFEMLCKNWIKFNKENKSNGTKGKSRLAAFTES